MSEFLQSYYNTTTMCRGRSRCNEPCEDEELLSRWLTEKSGHRVTFFVPQRGDQRQTAEMAYNNAAERLSLEGARTGKEVAVLDELARALGLEKAPSIIEAYDISNFGSETVVGGMVVFQDARPRRSDYKRFSIKTAAAPDDYACMREMNRAPSQALSDEKDSGTAFGRLPDLILLDGGRGHVSAVQGLLDDLGVSVPLFGMVKDDRHRTRAIAKNGGEIAISSWRSVFDFVTRIQDEVHRYTITYSRAKHAKGSFAMTMTNAPGIGEKRAAAVMKRFGP